MTEAISRREAMLRLMAFGATLPVTAATMNARDVRAARDAATPVASGGSLVHRGINYDVGTRVSPEFTTRPDSHRAFLHAEIEAIRDHLHCTSVGIFGEDVERLIEGATAALDAGLHVRVQPRLVDASPDDMLLTLGEIAGAAEPLRAAGDTELVLDVGCELTLLGGGIIPGATFAERLDYFLNHLDDLPDFNAALSDLLEQAVSDARSSFGGRLTYASGAWEAVDWSGFDIVSVDLYRDATNQENYLDLLRSYVANDKPVWITEFGCCAYEGADERGGSGFDIVDWTVNPPQIAEDVTRGAKRFRPATSGSCSISSGRKASMARSSTSSSSPPTPTILTIQNSTSIWPPTAWLRPTRRAPKTPMTALATGTRKRHSAQSPIATAPVTRSRRQRRLPPDRLRKRFEQRPQ